MQIIDKINHKREDLLNKQQNGLEEDNIDHLTPLVSGLIIKEK